MPDSICNASLRVMAAPTSPRSHVPQILPLAQGPTDSETLREAKERKKEKRLKEREKERRKGQRETQTSKPIGKQQLKVADSELQQIVKNKEKKIKKRAEILSSMKVITSVHSKAAGYNSR